MEEEQPAAAPIVGEELPGEAELQLAVEQEPVALEEAVPRSRDPKAPCIQGEQYAAYERH